LSAEFIGFNRLFVASPGEMGIGEWKGKVKKLNLSSVLKFQGKVYEMASLW